MGLLLDGLLTVSGQWGSLPAILNREQVAQFLHRSKMANLGGFSDIIVLAHGRRYLLFLHEFSEN